MAFKNKVLFMYLKIIFKYILYIICRYDVKNVVRRLIRTMMWNYEL